MISIPPQLKDAGYRFLKILPKSKRPAESWKENNYAGDDAPLKSWIRNNQSQDRKNKITGEITHYEGIGNYALLCCDSSIIIEVDTSEMVEYSMAHPIISKTLRTRSGSKRGTHFYIHTDKAWTIPLMHPTLLDESGKRTYNVGHIKSGGSYCVGPSSVHPSGNSYELLNEGADIQYVPFKGIVDFYKDYIFARHKNEPDEKTVYKSPIGKKNSASYFGLSMDMFMPVGKLSTSGDEIIGSSRWHETSTGTNYRVNLQKGTWYCTHCETGNDAIAAYAIEKGIISCGEAKKNCLEGKWAEIYRAREADGWVNPDKESDMEIIGDLMVNLTKKDDDEPEQYEEILPFSKKEIPAHLLTVPGVLGEFSKYIDAISVRSQPQFNVQTALALGATVLQRHYCTDQKNYPSLNFINIAGTSMGKEKAYAAITNVLTKSKRADLIGPSSYTGAGGVYSALINYPSHITIIDELGLLLEGNKHQKNGLAIQTMRLLMSIWGKLDSSLVVEGYSDMKKIMKDGIKNIIPNDKMIINCPAVTMLGMTTAKTFFDSLNDGDVKSGYIPRMLVSEYRGPVPKAKKIDNVEVPDCVVKWIEEHSHNIPQDSPVITPEPHTIKISNGGWELLEKIEDSLIEKMNDPKSGETSTAIYGKTREMIMRLSLIIAVSKESEEILPEHIEWARDYIMFHTERLIERIGSSLSCSQLERIENDIIRKISESGEHGITDREIFQQCWSVRTLVKKQRKSVMETLEEDYDICKHKIDGFQKREAWVEKKYITKCRTVQLV